MSDPSRRQFLEAVSLAALAVAQLEACNTGGSIDGSVTSSNGVAQLTFAQFPSLMTVGSGVVVSAPPGPIAVVRTGATTAAAVSAVCTHAGCTIEVASGPNLFCPCHGSEFSTNGGVIAGPARRPLVSYPATVDANGVNVMVG